MNQMTSTYPKLTAVCSIPTLASNSWRVFLSIMRKPACRITQTTCANHCVFGAQGLPTVFFRSGFAVHADIELARSLKGRTEKLDFEIFVSAIILDRNSPVCFHNGMVAEELRKSAVHDGVRSPSYNHC
jgi:hypothetical protein